VDKPLTLKPAVIFGQPLHFKIVYLFGAALFCC